MHVRLSFFTDPPPPLHFVPQNTYISTQKHPPCQIYLTFAKKFLQKFKKLDTTYGYVIVATTTKRRRFANEIKNRTY
jgi:hypothetical protein